MTKPNEALEATPGFCTAPTTRCSRAVGLPAGSWRIKYVRGEVSWRALKRCRYMHMCILILFWLTIAFSHTQQPVLPIFRQKSAAFQREHPQDCPHPTSSRPSPSAGRPRCSSAAVEFLLTTFGCRVINRKHGGFLFSFEQSLSVRNSTCLPEKLSLLSVTVTKLRLINNHITREKP